MLDPKLLRSEPEMVATNLAKRGFVLDVSALKAIEERRKHGQVRMDHLRNERNSRSKAVGIAKSKGEVNEIADSILSAKENGMPETLLKSLRQAMTDRLAEIAPPRGAA